MYALRRIKNGFRENYSASLEIAVTEYNKGLLDLKSLQRYSIFIHIVRS